MISKREEIEAALDQVGLEWYQAREQKDSAVQLKLQEDMFHLIYKLMDKISHGKDYKDKIGDFYIKNLEQYNPLFHGEEAPFHKFLYVKLKYALLDEYGNKTKELQRLQSLDDLSDDESDDRNQKQYADASAEEAFDQCQRNEAMIDLLSLVINMTQNLKGRSNNETRRNYFRLFTTETITIFSKELSKMLLVQHERDMFQAMKLQFLDYYMSSECRTIQAISDTHLKLYGEVVEGQKMEEMTLPLNNPVYVTYLREKENYEVGGSAVSMQRKEYLNLLDTLKVQCEERI